MYNRRARTDALTQMWTLIGSLADIRQPHAVNVYVKEKALARLAEREAWRRRFSLARFSNVAPAPAPAPAPEPALAPENVVSAEAEVAPVPHDELMSSEEDIDKVHDDENDDEWSIL